MGPEAEHGEVSRTDLLALGTCHRSLVTSSRWVNGCKISSVILGSLLTLCISFNFIDLS